MPKREGCILDLSICTASKQNPHDCKQLSFFNLIVKSDLQNMDFQCVLLTEDVQVLQGRNSLVSQSKVMRKYFHKICKRKCSESETQTREGEIRKARTSRTLNILYISYSSFPMRTKIVVTLNNLFVDPDTEVTAIDCKWSKL